MDERSLIINKVIELIPFMGINDDTLYQACLSLEKPNSFCKFPDGINEVLMEINNYFIDLLKSSAVNIELESMSVRNRIKCLLKMQLLNYTQLLNYREFLQNVFSFAINPNNTIFANKMLFNTVSNVWYLAGDRSSDFNFYTKRLTLATAYLSIVLFFINDYSEGHNDSISFIERTIDNILKLIEIRMRVKSTVKKIFFK